MNKLTEIATQVRRDILRMTHHASSGHTGGSLGCADLLTYMFFEAMRIEPEKFTMNGAGEDMFFLSNGHISPVFYAVLARRGYFPVDELSTFRMLNSRLQGHPTPQEGLPGVRVASGSLGQGMSVAIGSAMAKKLNNDPHLVFSLHGDGEMQEGQNWEALLFAAHHKVDNLISIIDYNHKQIDGTLEDVMSLGNLRDKINSFDWKTYEMDGNDFDSIGKTMNEAIRNSGKGQPQCVIMHTFMGKGVDFMENDHHWHGKAPNDEQLESALAQLPETIGDFRI